MRKYECEGEEYQYYLSGTSHVSGEELDEFAEKLENALFHEAVEWEAAEKRNIVVTICEDIRKSDDEKDYVAVALESEDGKDGGYLHVFGFKESEE